MNIYKASLGNFLNELEYGQILHEDIRNATTPIKELLDAGCIMLESACYLTLDEHSGFMISPDGELTSLFSRVPGRGDFLMEMAIGCGATHLDCFDGFLFDFYTKHGFTERCRKPNWIEGGPDIIYMNR